MHPNTELVDSTHSPISHHIPVPGTSNLAAPRDPNLSINLQGQDFRHRMPPAGMGHAPNKPSTIAANEGGLGMKKLRKRQRPSEEHSKSHNASSPKRHHVEIDRVAPLPYHPSAIPTGPQVLQRPIEVISLLDDDYPPRPYDNNGVSPAPQSLIQGLAVDPQTRYDSSIQASYYQKQALDTFPLQAQGMQHTPYEIPFYPPPELPVDTKHNRPDLSEFAHSAPAPPNPDKPSDDVVPITEPELCKEQADLVNLILSGRNVFYTGSAGCGKSTVLKAFVKRFQERGMRVNIIAPTGRAALDINGSTTWTYAGWTPDSHKKSLKDLKIAAHGKFVRQRLSDTDVLVIDEISMVENLHFERLNVVMKEARNNTMAFGGVQLVVTGDFCQLPPVKPFGHCIECGKALTPNSAGTEYKCREHGIYNDIDKWAFRSRAWEECDFKHVNLTNIHRQSDTTFINILQKLRLGRPLLPTEIDLLLNHESETRNAIKLFATRAEVKRVNDEMFAKLRTKARTYKSLDNFQWNVKHRHLESKKTKLSDGSLEALRDHRFDPEIRLKKGMLVVLLHNLDIAAGLVNGSQGTIQGFEDYDKAKMPQTSQSSRKGRDREMDLGVSGGPALAGGSVLATGPVLVGDHALYREHQIKDYIKQAEERAWPVVRFLNGVERTIYADCTVNEYGDEAPYSLLSRTQIPLMAAWAITTHKSQGMTLNRVIVDLSKTFEQGQAYVALSRARSLEGLKVESIPQRAQSLCNAQVKEFLRDKFGIQ